jgi:hypothetical protein
MDWTELLKEPLQALAAIAFAALVYVAGKLATAGLKAAAAYVESHDLGYAEGIISAAIVYASKALQEQTGAERMDFVLAYAEQHGIDVDEVRAEAVYQTLLKQDKLAKAETAVTAVPAPATAMEVAQ